LLPSVTEPVRVQAPLPQQGGVLQQDVVQAELPPGPLELVQEALPGLVLELELLRPLALVLLPAVLLPAVLLPAVLLQVVLVVATDVELPLMVDGVRFQERQTYFVWRQTEFERLAYPL